MKAKIYFKIILTMSIFALGAMTTVSCSKDEPEPYADYFGTWRDDSDCGQVTITANKLVYIEDNGNGYTLENLTWTPITNSSGDYKTTHPTGYIIIGKLTTMSGYGPFKPDKSSDADIGETGIDWWYISTDKQSLMWGYWESSDNEAAFGPYVKQ